MNINRIFNTIIFTALLCVFNPAPLFGMDSISMTSTNTEQKSMVPKLQDLCAKFVSHHVCDWPKYFAAADGDTIKDLYYDVIAIRDSDNFIPLPSDAIKRIGAAYCVKQDYDPELTQKLKGHKDWITHMLLHGDELISGSADKTIRRWDLKTGQCTQVLKGHTSSVTCMLLHGDELISGSTAGILSDDNTIRRWNLKTNQCMQVLQGHEGWVSCMLLYGDELLSGSDNTRRWSRGSFAYHLIKRALANCENDQEQLQKIGSYLQTIPENELTEQEYNKLEQKIENYMPAQASCTICCKLYNTRRTPVQLSCCNQLLCKACAHTILETKKEHSAEFEGQQLTDVPTDVGAQCPYCKKPADQIQLLEQKKIRK